MSSKEDLILKFLEKIDNQTEKTEKKVEEVDAKCDALEKRQIRHEASVNQRLDKYNSELTRHIEGVKIQAKRNDRQDSRLDALEKPSDTKVTTKTLSKWAVWAGKAAVAGLAIIKLVEYAIKFL